MFNKCLKYFFMKQYTLVSIEGNIGSGKSTLLKLMKERYPDLYFIPEPVNEWQQINGDPNLNLLGAFYENPHRWAYTMQVYAFYSRLKYWKQILQKIDNKIILSERSIEADKQIFAINGYKNGIINKLEYALYEQFYQWLVDEIFNSRVEKQLIIYLQVDPIICQKRMKKRAREEEKDLISLDYLKQIHERHEEWLIKENKQLINTQVLVLNADKEFENDNKQQDFMFNSISDFIKIVN